VTCKQRKKPIRTCVACRNADDKRALVRFVRLADGTVQLDASGKQAGRGAYVCADAECFAKARKTRALERALRCPIAAADYDRLSAVFGTEVIKNA